MKYLWVSGLKLNFSLPSPLPSPNIQNKMLFLNVHKNLLPGFCSLAFVHLHLGLMNWGSSIQWCASDGAQILSAGKYL
jgi:hypothetical protein